MHNAHIHCAHPPPTASASRLLIGTRQKSRAEEWLVIILSSGLLGWRFGQVRLGVSSREESSDKVPQDGVKTPEGRKDVGNKRSVSSASYFCLGMMSLSSYFTVSPL